MAYKIYLTDGIDIAALDAETFDSKTIFSTADIKDLSVRKDNYKNIRLKGTKQNNYVFGQYFDLSQTTNPNLNNGLYFNHSPLKQNTCFVYENNELIFKGTLRLLEWNYDRLGNVYYDCVITGSYIDFTAVIQDKYLTDLDFSDLTHRYTITNITNSWVGINEKTNTSTSAFTSTTGGYGDGYVYPYIDYGAVFQSENKYDQINASNFRPAIYLTEYFDRIFSQKGLSGFTYEVKGSPEFKEMFNHLVVPYCNEGLTQLYSGWTTTYSKAAGVDNQGNSVTDGKNSYKIVPLVTKTNPPIKDFVQLDTTPVYSALAGGWVNVGCLKVLNNFTSDGKIDFFFNRFTNQGQGDIFFYIQFVKRTPEIAADAVANNVREGNWSVVSEYVFKLPPMIGTARYNVPITLLLGSTEYQENDILDIQIRMESPIASTGFYNGGYWDLATAVLSFPASPNSFLKMQVSPVATITGDTITPTASLNIKQKDFITSVLKVFNLFVYAKKENYKHLIFEKYDDYYALCQLPYLQTQGLDWSKKLDYTQGIKGKSNVDLPRSYLFTFKEDKDYFNDEYKKKFNQVYGQLAFNDSQGLLDTKKIETVFSPSIISQDNTDRKFMSLYSKQTDGSKKQIQTNIRLAFYNGLQPCNEYTIQNESFNGTDYVKQDLYTDKLYPQLSNYYLSGTTVISDIHFGQPLQYFIPANDDYVKAPTSYRNFYVNQVLELTDTNVKYYECFFLLNELDIANFDPKIPIYIDGGVLNSGYYKVLSLEYESNKVPSKVTLQRIVV